jgi:hypothetical protein
VAVILVVSFATIHAPGLASSASPTGGTVAQAFASTDAAAMAWASSFRGGGWGVLGAGGYALPGSQIPNGSVTSSAFINISDGGSSCAYTSLVPAGQTFKIAATPGNRTAGSGSYWRVDMTNASNGVLTVLELGGVIEPLAVGTCSGNFSQFFQFQALPPAIIDSPAAASAALAAGGAAFVHAHPDFYADYAISDGYTSGQNGSSTPPEWMVAFVDCGSPPTQGPSTQFSATVDALTGAILQAGDSNGYCSFPWLAP